MAVRAQGRGGRFVRLLVGVVMAAAALVAVSPPPAAAEDPSNCVGAFECLYLVPSNGASVRLGGTALDLIPVDSKPGGVSGDPPWEGTFFLVGHEGRSEAPFCLSASREFLGIGPGWEICTGRMPQAFYFEPASGQSWTDRDVIDTDSWSAWDSSGSPDYFYIKSATSRGLEDRCLELGAGASDVDVRPCDGTPAQKVEFQTPPAPSDPEELQQALDNQERVTARILGAALEFAAQRCAQHKSDCSVQLRDGTTGARLSGWDRIDQLTINARPNPVIRAAGCASGEGPQSIYNGGTEPMSTTIGASATSELSQSVNTSLAVENTFSFGKDSAFFKYELKVTVSVEYGRTWTESSTVSQEVQWTIPSRRFATATLATASVLGSASWRMNERVGSAHPWETKDVVDLAIPYAARSNASTPDTTLAVHNSWGQKMCDAAASAVLADDHQVSVTNTTVPGAGPIPGDVLTANAEPSWWEEPAAMGAGAPGVNLIYQWYRQRGSEAPSAIPGATKKTYTVTGDDVTDDEILEWVGPYHLYVGVTDVANANRFDSLESFAVATDATRSERRPVTTGPKPTTLRIAVQNPGASATEDTEIAVEASTDSASTIPTGTVTIYDVNGPLADATLGADGTGRTWVRLAPGVHEMAATYLGDGSSGAAVSTRVRTTVRRAATATTLQMPSRVRALAPTTARVSVEGEGGTPAGTVRLYDGVTPLGAAVPLDGDGTARIDLEGFDGGGSRDLSASYAGSSLYASSTSDERTVDVTEIPTSTDLRIEGTAAPGGALRVTALVDGGSAPTPTGAVQFTDRGRTLGGPVPLVDGSASTRIADLVAGARHTLRAEYEPEGPYDPSTSRERDVTVASAATSVGLAASPAVTARGDRVTVRARVRAGGAEPRGTVRFFADGRALGSRTVDSDGLAVLRTSALPAGNLRVSAQFVPGSGSGLVSAWSPTIRQDVRQYRAQVRAAAEAQALRRTDPLVVSGSVRIAGRLSTPLTTRRVWLVVDGRRVTAGSTQTGGAFTLRLPARRLAKGRHLVSVQYAGSTRPSVAPGGSAVIVVRRR